MERTNLASNDWTKPVIAVPLVQAFPEFNDVKEFRSKQCLFSHDRTKLFGVVSRKYQVIDHKAAVDSTAAAIKHAYGQDPILTVTSIAGGARMRAEFNMPWLDPIEVAPNDLVHLKVLLFNAHDSMWKFGLSIGALRQVCSNGMMIGERFGSITAKHFPALAQPDLLSEKIKGLMDKSVVLKDVWKRWSNTSVTHAQATEMLTKNFPEKYLKPVLEKTRFNRSKWELYNDLTAFATHSTKTVNRRVEFDTVISKLFYRDLP